MPTMPPRRMRPRLRPCAVGSTISRFSPATWAYGNPRECSQRPRPSDLAVGVPQHAEQGALVTDVLEMAVERRGHVAARRTGKEADRRRRRR